MGPGQTTCDIGASIPKPAKPWAFAFVAVGVFVYAALMVYTSWLHEDCFITLRVIDNFWNGYGLRWNILERVQVYTHPLWMLLLAIPYGITREAVITTQITCLVLSLATLVVFAFFLARRPGPALLGLFLLWCGQAFFDYCSSGLENPLLHFLLALFLLVYFREGPPLRRLFLLAFLTALIACARMDAILLVAPPLAWTAWPLRRARATWGVLACASLPFVLWEAFSVVYYGFPFPNTAYAKLGHGYSAGLMLTMGVQYFAALWNHDPCSSLLLVAGILLPYARRVPKEIALSIGVTCYAIYVLKIGGDYNVGRLISCMVFVAVVLLVRACGAWRPVLIAGIACAALAVATTAPAFPFLKPQKIWGHKTYHDARSLNYGFTNILLYRNGKNPITPGRDSLGAESAPTQVIEGVFIGRMGYQSKPHVHIVDMFALCDPFLARLPAVTLKDVPLAGHYLRHVPKGYEESIRAAANRVEDPKLAEYYAVLSRITQGPIWDKTRWCDLVRMNLGGYDYLLRDYRATATRP